MAWVNPAPAVGVAIVRDGAVLLSRRAQPPKQGEWDLVGGFVEPGEDASAGARREVLEETGLAVRELDLVVTAPGSYAGRPTLNLLFTGRVDADAVPRAADDSMELRWFTLAQLPQLAWPHEAAFVRAHLGAQAHERVPSGRAARLRTLTWPDAGSLLGGSTLVVLPLGAAAKEHGPHLPLGTDMVLADGVADRLPAAVEGFTVVVAPTLTYHHYPAFSEFPGSTSLSFATAVHLVLDAVRSLAHHGPRRFYVLNTGLSTEGPLRAAANLLERDGITLKWTDWEAALDGARGLLEQTEGTHADEAETSLMLVLAPQQVRMDAAVRDVAAGPGPFGRARNPTGVFGDATLATTAKGAALLASLMAAVHADLEALARAA